MEAAAICAAVLAPFLAIAGASCGAASKLHGWASVRPIAFAIVGGIALHIDRPIGWVIGGCIGGLIDGLPRHSVGRTVKGALVGVSLGMIGWGLTWAYLIGSLVLLNYLGGR